MRPSALTVLTVASTALFSLSANAFLTSTQLDSQALDYAYLEPVPTPLNAMLYDGLIKSFPEGSVTQPARSQVQFFVDMYRTYQNYPQLEVETRVCQSLRTKRVDPILPVFNAVFQGLQTTDETVIEELETRYGEDQLLYTALLAAQGYTLAFVDSATRTTCPDQRGFFQEQFGFYF